MVDDTFRCERHWQRRDELVMESLFDFCFTHVLIFHRIEVLAVIPAKAGIQVWSAACSGSGFPLSREDKSIYRPNSQLSHYSNFEIPEFLR